MRARKAVHLGLAEDQAGYLLMDLETRKVKVSPHVRFAETVFPGLSARGGEFDHNLDQLFTKEELDAHDPAHLALQRISCEPPFSAPFEQTCEEIGDPSEVTNHPGLSERADDLIDEIETQSPSTSAHNPADSPEQDESHDEDSNIGNENPLEEAEEEGLISSRLDRARNPPDRFAYAATIPTPTSIFFLYIGSGASRDGDLQSEMKKLGGPIVVNIDLKVGGYDHDITYEGVQESVLKLARHPNCAGVFVSIPCKTFSVLRGRPGVENSYPQLFAIWTTCSASLGKTVPYHGR